MHIGEGTLPKLIQIPTAYQRLTDSLDRFNQIADQIQNGSGTISKLIQNPQLFDTANEALRKVRLLWTYREG